VHRCMYRGHGGHMTQPAASSGNPNPSDEPHAQRETPPAGSGGIAGERRRCFPAQESFLSKGLHTTCAYFRSRFSPISHCWISGIRSDGRISENLFFVVRCLAREVPARHSRRRRNSQWHQLVSRHPFRPSNAETQRTRPLDRHSPV